MNFPAIAPQTNPALPAPRQTGGTMGKDDFLQLLVAQLKNQDPMSPMNGEEFAAQLATFSQLEQLVGIRDEIKAGATSDAEIRHLLNTSLATDMIGKTVLVDGSTAEVDATGAGRVEMNVAGVGGAARITVKNTAGEVVYEGAAGTLEGGKQSISLTPLNLPAGKYSVEVNVKGADGAETPATIHSRIAVTGVQFGPGGIMLVPASGSPVPIGQVIEIVSAE